MLDVLPLFNVWEVHALGYDGVIPSGCWIQLFGFLSVFLGCLVFPHVPHESDQCFLDFSCIHQTERDKTKQGIMSISAFLMRSAELRVLWSAPLFSRLWLISKAMDLLTFKGFPSEQ